MPDGRTAGLIEVSRDFDDRPRAAASPVVEMALGVASTLIMIALLIGAYSGFAG